MADGIGARDGAGLQDWTAEIAQLEARLAMARSQLVARLVRRELQGEDPSHIDQTATQLGRNTHIAAVKRRIAEAERRGIPPIELGAIRKGRRYLLTRDAHAAEMGGAALPSVAKAAPPTAPPDDAAARLKHRLDQQRRARR